MGLTNVVKRLKCQIEIIKSKGDHWSRLQLWVKPWTNSFNGQLTLVTLFSATDLWPFHQDYDAVSIPHSALTRYFQTISTTDLFEQLWPLTTDQLTTLTAVTIESVGVTPLLHWHYFLLDCLPALVNRTLLRGGGPWRKNLEVVLTSNLVKPWQDITLTTASDSSSLSVQSDCCSSRLCLKSTAVKLPSPLEGKVTNQYTVELNTLGPKMCPD